MAFVIKGYIVQWIIIAGDTTPSLSNHLPSVDWSPNFCFEESWLVSVRAAPDTDQRTGEEKKETK